MSSTEFLPLVSIVIPVFNGSDYLAGAIDSALAQTYSETEIIVVNDGSDDAGKTRDIALSYGEKIRYIEKANGGVATALNLGIGEMEGEYLAWLSHDDKFLPHKLADQIKLLGSRSDRENVILFSDYTIHNIMTGERVDARAIDPSLMDSSPTYRWLQALFASKLHGCTSLIPKAVIRRIGHFDASLRTTQDYDFFCRALRTGIKFVLQDKCLIITRHHEHQGTLTNRELHSRELQQFFQNLIDMFCDDLASYQLVFLETFLGILKQRGQIDAYIHLFNVWCAGRCEIDATPLWLYWECAEGSNIPEYIFLCWKTIALHCQRDFRVTVVSPSTLKQYLPAIDPCYQSLKQIAHRADFIRFNLLYEHGGIWMDSDYIMFRSLKPVLHDMKSTGFALMGYRQKDNGDIFPIISFLAAAKHNDIAGKMVTLMKEKIHAIIQVEKRQPEWDEIGGYLLREAIKQSKSGYFFYEAIEYFSYLPFWRQFIPCLEDNDLASLYKLIHPTMFAQSLTNSRDMDSLAQFSEEEILSRSSLLSNLFKVGFSGARQYPQSNLVAAKSLSTIRARLRNVPFLVAVYRKGYLPSRRMTRKILRGVFSLAAWKRLLRRGVTRLYKKNDVYDVREVFSGAYRTNIWNCPESRSGEGSTLEGTSVIRAQLPKLLEEYGIGVFLDLPCGDFNWMKHVSLGDTIYIGGDIVRDIVESNQALYGEENRSFVELDLITDELPSADMILCRDCLIHLSFKDIDSVLKNLHRSGIKYLLTNTYPAHPANKDINTGEFRSVNLRTEPFLFPEPLWIIHEGCSENSSEEEKRFSDKSMGLWLIKDLPFGCSVINPAK